MKLSFPSGLKHFFLPKEINANVPAEQIAKSKHNANGSSLHISRINHEYNCKKDMSLLQKHFIASC